MEIDRGLKAKELFLKGYNCSQSLVLAFQDKLNMDEKTLASLASSFGGGMGRLREVCGAVSGMFLVIGLLYGYNDPKDYEGKKKQYELVQKLAAKYKECNGSIVCKELLHLDSKSSPIPEKRTKEYYKKRPCPELIAQAAYILDEEIKNHERISN